MERREEPSKEKRGNNEQYKRNKKRKGEDDLRSDARSVPVKISLVGESNEIRRALVACSFFIITHGYEMIPSRDYQHSLVPRPM